MKKLFILSISLILLFGFVSCDNATKEPTTNSNSTSIPGEITPPDSSKLVEISPEQQETIEKALKNYVCAYDSPISSTSHQEFTIKDDTKIDGKTVSGSLTQDSNIGKKVSISNGELKIDNDVYKFNNLEMKYDEQGKPAFGTGSFTKNGNKASINDLMSLSPIMNGLGKDNYSKLIYNSTTVYELSSSSKELEITGTFARFSSYDLNSDLNLDGIVIDAKVDGKALRFKQTRSYKSPAGSEAPKYENTINYLGYDGVFFNEESIKKVFPNNPF